MNATRRSAPSRRLRLGRAARPRPSPPPLLALFLALFLGLGLSACAGPGPAGPPRAADLVVRNATLLSLEGPPREDAALAVIDGTIVWIGDDDDDAEAWIGPRTYLLDLRGRPLLPGFADAHLHLRNLGRLLANLDLVGTTSVHDIATAVGDAADIQPRGSWILGRGWDQNDFDEPTRRDARAASGGDAAGRLDLLALDYRARLDAVAPEHPVALKRIDGHAMMVNSAALAAAGLDVDTPDPPGGRLLRTPDGELNGVLVDKAMNAVTKVIPEPGAAERRRQVEQAIELLHGYGLTSVHDASTDRDDIELYTSMAEDGAFPLRAHLMLNANQLSEDFSQLDGRPTPSPTDDLTGHGRLSLRAIKVSADGALGSRGAALLEDYSDDPGNRGLVLYEREDLQRLAEFALANGWQLATHAIGDRANRQVLDAYEAALAVHPVEDHRLRVEHAQVLHPDEVGRFAELGVIPSMQAQHQTSDAPWATERLGEERARLAYAWRSLLDTGVRLPGGSDAPVEVPDPLAAYRSAVTRLDEVRWPESGWHPEQAMTREEALLSITLWPAWAAFREDELGSLAVGKRADMVVLDTNPLEIPVEIFGPPSVLMTIFDGVIVFEAERHTQFRAFKHTRPRAEKP